MNPLNNGLIVPRIRIMYLLQIQPETIRILNTQGEPPQELNF